MKFNALESLQRSPNPDDTGGGTPEKKLTPETMRELVRNLDVTKIENLDFKNAIVDFAPEAKMVLGDKNNLKEALLALSDSTLISPPLNKEGVMKLIGKKSILLNEPDWDKIEKNGSVFFPTSLAHFVFVKETKNPVTRMRTNEYQGELYKDFADEPTLELLTEIHKKYIKTQRRGEADPELIQQLKDREINTGNTLYQDESSIGYIFPLEKQILTEDATLNRDRVFNEELFPTVTFEYQGHTFKIFRNPSDNTPDQSLQENDNPFLLKRFGSWFNLKIDGESYKEKTYDPNLEKLEGDDGIYDGFNSWRKWIDYRDIVVKN